MGEEYILPGDIKELRYLLQDRRLELGISIRTLSRKTSITRYTISSLENKLLVIPYMAKIHRVCSALSISDIYLAKLEEVIQDGCAFQEIGDHIKKLRSEQGLTTAKLAQSSNLRAGSCVSRIENEGNPMVTTLYAVAKALNRVPIALQYKTPS